MSNETKDWAGFGSEYIKAIEVKNKTDEYAIVGVDSKIENGRKTLILEIERNGIKKIFGCNQSNLQAVQAVCPNSPEQAIGRIVTFNKVQVQNPNTHQVVDGLRLQFKRRENDPQQELIEDSGIAEDGTI
jgi:hypothetical protein